MTPPAPRSLLFPYTTLFRSTLRVCRRQTVARRPGGCAIGRMEPLTHQQMYIDGEWVDAVSRFEIVNPATEELVATVARGGVDHADSAVDAAARAHAEATWRSAAPADRAELLDAIAAGLERRIDELVALEV